MREVLVYAGSAIVAMWGIGHLFATGSVVAGFVSLTTDNRRIINMEWIAEGLTLCFLGVLGALVVLEGGLAHPAGRAVILAAAGMLFVMAGLTAASGARTSIAAMKACPIVKSVVAALFVAAAGMN